MLRLWLISELAWLALMEAVLVLLALLRSPLLSALHAVSLSIFSRASCFSFL